MAIPGYDHEEAPNEGTQSVLFTVPSISDLTFTPASIPEDYRTIWRSSRGPQVVNWRFGLERHLNAASCLWGKSQGKSQAECQKRYGMEDVAPEYLGHIFRAYLEMGEEMPPHFQEVWEKRIISELWSQDRDFGLIIKSFRCMGEACKEYKQRGRTLCILKRIFLALQGRLEMFIMKSQPIQERMIREIFTALLYGGSLNKDEWKHFSLNLKSHP